MKSSKSNHSTSASLPWAFSSLFLCSTLLWLPLVSVNKLGIERSIKLGDLGQAIRQEQATLLGWFVDACLLVAPLFIIFALLYLALAEKTKWALPGQRKIVHLFQFAQRWAMLEVLILAVLVSFLKIGALAQATIKLGFIVLILAAICLILAQEKFKSGTITTRKNNHEASTQASWALLVAAAIALIPANLLPIMEMEIAGSVSQSTILGGIVLLVEEGMWMIAAIVFIASFLVPLTKVAGLALLLNQARFATGTEASLKIHHWIDFIGRWSMLDVLLIAVLTGLIQFGTLAQVRPGLGAAAFAAAVILTILAVEAFPLQRLFPYSPNRRPNAPLPPQL
jgi:paraquat-inducible protein A